MFMAHKGEFLAGINKKDPDGINDDGKPYRVLIIDDSSAMRRLLSQIFKSEAFDVVGEGSNGEEAISKYKELKPDIITLDIHMPVMDGMTALQKILDFDSSARIVMLTSDQEQQNVLNAISMGAKDYIIKPPERAVVLQKIKKSLQ